MSTRGRWALVSVAIASSLLFGIVATGCSDDTRSAVSDLEFWPEAFPDEPWAEEVFDEQALNPMRDDDELLFTGNDYETRYTNVDGYERRTLAGSGPVVWFFGGSSTFGFGQRDDHTTPSEVVRIAADAGTPVQVRNFGFPAYLAWQETVLLGRLLETEPPPDLIVINHGINDYAALCRQLARGETVGAHDNFLLDEIPKDAKVDCQADPDETGRLLDRTVQAEVERARAFAGDIPLIETWQPYSATRPASDADGPLFDRLDSTREGSDAHTRAYRVALDLAERPVVDLTDAIGPDVEGPIYYDWVHTNERGARLIAEAMWERSLRDEVAALG